jgi:hypothetical protein
MTPSAGSAPPSGSTAFGGVGSAAKAAGTRKAQNNCRAQDQFLQHFFLRLGFVAGEEHDMTD